MWSGLIPDPPVDAGVPPGYTLTTSMIPDLIIMKSGTKDLSLMAGKIKAMSSTDKR